MNTRISKRGVAAGVLAVLAVGGLGATAVAERGMHHGGMERHVKETIDAALAAAQATPAQRDAIEAAEQRAFDAVRATHADRGADVDALLSLFSGEQLDGARIAAIRAAREAAMQRAGDAIEGAVVAAHDTLTHEQRAQVAAYVREHRPSAHRGFAGKTGERFGGEMMKHFASKRLDDALSAANVTAAQRPQIEAARDQLFDRLAALHADGGPGAILGRALALFSADTVDRAAIATLRAEQHERMKQAADAIEQFAFDLHDTLSAPQRKALVAWAEARRAEWQEHAGRAHHGDDAERTGPSTDHAAPPAERPAE